MDKLLTILITHHNEPVEIGEPLFQSIDTQIGGVFDKIKIILSNNDSQQISMPNFPISKYKNVQNCVSTIKSTSQNTLSSHLNYLISKVDTPYFCFIDYDDRICNITTLKEILKYIELLPQIDVFCFNRYYWDKFFNIVDIKNIAMSGGWGCVYKLSSWRKKLPPFPEINAQHDIAMHYCICANDQILKKNIESVPFVCWCRRNKSESRQYFLNGDNFLEYCEDTLRALLYVKHYMEEQNLEMMKFTKYFIGEALIMYQNIDRYGYKKSTIPATVHKILKKFYTDNIDKDFTTVENQIF